MLQKPHHHENNIPKALALLYSPDRPAWAPDPPPPSLTLPSPSRHTLTKTHSVITLNVPGMVFTSLSLPSAVIELLTWLHRWRHQRTPLCESPIRVSKLSMLADLLLGFGLLLTWIITLIAASYREEYIACFALFCAW